MKIHLPQLIQPYDPDRVVNCSYELSLGEQIFVTGADKTKRYITPGTQIVIPPGQFANLLTKEIVRIPDTALGLISMKFTLKQPGLVNVSGFHVDPGYRGRLLFSVYNAGPQAVPITSGEPAFLLWYCALDAATEDIYSKAPRVSITDSDVKSLGGDASSPPELARRLNRLEDLFKLAVWVLGTVAAAGIALWLGVAFADNPPDARPIDTTSVAPSPATTSNPPSPRAAPRARPRPTP